MILLPFIAVYLLVGYAATCVIVYAMSPPQQHNNRIPGVGVIGIMLAWPVLAIIALLGAAGWLAWKGIKHLALGPYWHALVYILSGPMRLIRMLEAMGEVGSGSVGTTDSRKLTRAEQQAALMEWERTHGPTVVYRVTTGQHKSALQDKHHWADQASSWCWCGQIHRWDTAKPIQVMQPGGHSYLVGDE